MENKTIKIVVLMNNLNLISEIEEVGSDIGEPDCKLTNPFSIKDSDMSLSSKVLEPFLINITSQNVFMMSSDKILTLAEPTEDIIKKYKELVK